MHDPKEVAAAGRRLVVEHFEKQDYEVTEETGENEDVFYVVAQKFNTKFAIFVKSRIAPTFEAPDGSFQDLLYEEKRSLIAFSSRKGSTSMLANVEFLGDDETLVEPASPIRFKRL